MECGTEIRLYEMQFDETRRDSQAGCDEVDGMGQEASDECMDEGHETIG